MATEYEVWLTARHPQTLEVVGSIRVYHHAYRLNAERVLGTATDHYEPVARMLRIVQPGALVSSEMKHPVAEAHAYLDKLEALCGRQVRPITADEMQPWMQPQKGPR